MQVKTVFGGGKLSEENYRHSSYRENVLTHLFIGRCLQKLWVRGIYEAEVLKADVDASGYDVVVEAAGVARHIQLKASLVGGRTASQKINLALADKPAGCVVWMVCRPDTLDFQCFRWFGSGPHEPLALPTNLRTAKHTKGDSTGDKKERAQIRVLPKGLFETIDDLDDLLDRLFWPLSPK